MNETVSNSAHKPWREVLQVGSSTPDRDAIHARRVQLSRDVSARCRDEWAELNRAYDEALAELFHEHI